MLGNLRIASRLNKDMLNIFKLPSFWLLFAFVCAILTFNKVNVSYPEIYFVIYIPIIISGLISIIMLFILKVKSNFILYFFVLILLFFSFALFILPQLTKSDYHIKNFIGFGDKISKIEIEIMSHPTEFNYSYSKGFSFDAEVVNVYSQDVKIQSCGKLKVYYYDTDNPFSIGDRVFINKFPEYDPSYFIDKGKLNTLNIPMFLSLSHNNVLSHIQNNNPIYINIYKVRNYAINFYDKYLSEEVSTLAKSMIVGDRSGVDKSLKEQFAITNTSHLLSISGLHLGIIIFGILSLIKFIGVHRKLRVIIIAPFVMFFVLLVGSRAGIVRASFMVIIAMIGYDLLERKRNNLNILFLTGFVILLFDPSSLFDVGYQLSFLSVFAILFFFVPIQRVFQAKISFYKRNILIRQLITFIVYVPLITLIIQIFTFPVVIVNFGVVNVLSMLSNLVLIFLFTFFLYGISILIVFSFLPSILLEFLSAFSEFLGRLFLIIIEYFSKMSYNIRLNDIFLYILIIAWMLVIISLSILIMIFTGNTSSIRSLKRKNLFAIH